MWMDLQGYSLSYLILLLAGVGATFLPETGINGATAAEKSAVCEENCCLPIREGSNPQMLW